MSRRAKSARLFWIDRSAYERDSYWQIRDGTSRVSTGTDNRDEAEKALSEYIERKHRPAGPASTDEMTVGRCLSLYGEEHAVNVASPERIGYAIDALYRFWGEQPISSIRGETCRRYARERGASDGTVRRELGTLRAAINHCFKEGYLTAAPAVVLPARPAPRERWLTRQETAFLLTAARSLRIDGRHLAYFILCGLYTGSRKQTILNLHINMPTIHGGYVDTVSGVLYRKPQGKVMTAKRQTPARLPTVYLARLRRQAAKGRRFVVEDHRGNRVGDIRKGWENAKQVAQDMARARGIDLDLSEVTPHTLKHTAITWALQNGATIWDAAGYFGTSVDTIERVYGHHSPDHQKSAVEAINRRSK
jgi:integrase